MELHTAPPAAARCCAFRASSIRLRNIRVKLRSSRHRHPLSPGNQPQPEDARHADHALESAARAIERYADPARPLVHRQQIIAAIRRKESAASRANGWLANHVVGLAGTMAFFHSFWLLIAGWVLWQPGIIHNRGFDPYPCSFFFILGGIMQSLFVPTMPTASNRAAEHDRIKDEADHRACSHPYQVNDDQLRLLQEILDLLAAARPGSGPAAE